MKNKNTTLSEKNPMKKLKKEAKSLNLTHKYITTCYPVLVQAGLM